MHAELAENPAFARSLLAYISASFTACSSTSRRVHADRDAARGRFPGAVDEYDAARRERNVLLGAPKTVVASQLNLTAAHFSRVLRDLTTARLIRVNGREVVIENEDGLRAYVNGSNAAES